MPDNLPTQEKPLVIEDGYSIKSPPIVPEDYRPGREGPVYGPSPLLLFPKMAAVVKAADRLNQCLAEFPDYPAAWREYLDALHDALAKCPGTRTHAMAEESHKMFLAEQEDMRAEFVTINTSNPEVVIPEAGVYCIREAGMPQTILEMVISEAGVYCIRGTGVPQTTRYLNKGDVITLKPGGILEIQRVPAADEADTPTITPASRPPTPAPE